MSILAQGDLQQLFLHWVLSRHFEAMSWKSGYGRYAPYVEEPACALQLWTGGFSQTHVKKPTPNTDRFFNNERGLGVFDGVGGVAELGLDPAEMADYMCTAIEAELAKRSAGNAQCYDRNKQLTLQSSILPGCCGWLRNLCATALFETSALGSTFLGVCHLTGRKIDYTMLGDVVMYLYRSGPNKSAYEVMRTPVVRNTSVGSVPVPPQVCLYQASAMSVTHVETVFKQAVTGSLSDIRPHDTIVLVSDGVGDNIGSGKVMSLVSEMYETWQSQRTFPDDLAKDIVGASIASAHRQGGKPDDTTCVVACL